jgi:LysM repeat protein
VRHGVLLGSAAGILLVGAVAGVALHRGGWGDAAQPPAQLASLSPERAAPERSPPAVGPAAQPAHPAPPSFDIVKVGPTGTAVIAGRAEPGSRVTVRDGDKIIGEVTADRRGEWVLVPDQPIGPGDRLLSLEASSRGGDAVTKSDETVALSVAPAAPGRQGETALAVVLPRDGGGPARVLQRPDTATSDKPGPLSVDTVQHDVQGRMALSGRAQPGATVRIYLGEEPIATATADAAGGWLATSTTPPGSSRLELRLDQLTQDGKLAQRIVVPLAEVAAAAPGKSYVVQPGNSLWQIARQTYGNGVQYLIIYSANLGQISDPDRIYPGQVFKLPKS